MGFKQTLPTPTRRSKVTSYSSHTLVIAPLSHLNVPNNRTSNEHPKTEMIHHYFIMIIFLLATLAVPLHYYISILIYCLSKWYNTYWPSKHQRSQSTKFYWVVFFFCPWLEFTVLLMCVNQEIYVNIVMYKYVCNIYYFLRSLELFMCSYCTSIHVSSFHMPCIISLHAVVGKVKLSFTNLQKP